MLANQPHHTLIESITGRTSRSLRSSIRPSTFSATSTIRFCTRPHREGYCPQWRLLLPNHTAVSPSRLAGAQWQPILPDSPSFEVIIEASNQCHVPKASWGQIFTRICASKYRFSSPHEASISTHAPSNSNCSVTGHLRPNVLTSEIWWLR